MSRSFAAAVGFAVGAGGYDVRTAMAEIKQVRCIVSNAPMDEHHATVHDFVAYYAGVTLEGISYGASAPAASPPFTGSNMTQGGWKMGPRGYKVTLGRWKMASGGGNMAQGGWKMGPRGCKVTLGSWKIGSGGGRMAQEGWKRGWDGWEISFGGWKMALGDWKMVIGNCKMDLLAGNMHFS